MSDGSAFAYGLPDPPGDARGFAGGGAPAAVEPLLEVRGLSIGYRDWRRERIVRIVDDVSFSVGRGEALGLAGESGCGKTTAALALLGLLPRPLERTQGEIVLHSRKLGVAANVHKGTPQAMRALRWRAVSMIFQGAMNALDPVQRVGDQIAEPIRLHEPEVDQAAVDARVVELFEQVGIAPSRRSQYPHEFSGGMRQRVMIALALACRPELVIADEPTTALDVMTQAQVLELLEELRRELGLALILITHDLSVIGETCDRVAIMYGGQLVEQGPVSQVYGRPEHPYTQRLLGGFPAIGGPRALAAAIPGQPPDPAEKPAGCRFHPRCHRLVPGTCDVERQELRTLADGREVRCAYAPWPAEAAP